MSERQPGFERDRRKLETVERMRRRAVGLAMRALFAEPGPTRRKFKRSQRLSHQADRIMEVRLARFQAARAEGRWP